jgi:hypothetical protein
MHVQAILKPLINESMGNTKFKSLNLVYKGGENNDQQIMSSSPSACKNIISIISKVRNEPQNISLSYINSCCEKIMHIEEMHKCALPFNYL